MVGQSGMGVFNSSCSNLQKLLISVTIKERKVGRNEAGLSIPVQQKR